MNRSEALHIALAELSWLESVDDLRAYEFDAGFVVWPKRNPEGSADTDTVCIVVEKRSGDTYECLYSHPEMVIDEWLVRRGRL
jgi:hypothetical protein